MRHIAVMEQLSTIFGDSSQRWLSKDVVSDPELDSCVLML